MKVFLDTNILLDYVDHREKRIYANFHQFCDLPFLTSEEFLLQFDYDE